MKPNFNYFFKQTKELNSDSIISGGGIRHRLNVLLTRKKAFEKSLKWIFLSLIITMVTPFVNKVTCSPADPFYLKNNGDTVFVEEIDNVHSIEVNGNFPDSIFNEHGVIYENIFGNTWSLFGNLDSIPQAFLDSFSLNPAYTHNPEYVDTLYLLNQIVVYWEDNINPQQRSNFESLHNLTYHSEINRITIFDVGDPFDKFYQVHQDQMVEFSMPRFLATGIVPHNIPNDEYFTKQWYLNNTGQEIQGKHGIAGADINVLPAWEYVKGAGVNVAVIDEGVPIHPDLPISRQIRGHVSNLYKFLVDPNPDLGSNKYADPSPVAGEAHGTAVAGVIAAEMNNEEGIVGVAPESNVIPIRIRYKPMPVDAIYQAMYLAREYGADIIVCSFGLGEFFFHFTQLGMNETIDEGVFLVCSAGNNADHEYWKSGKVGFPASYNLPGVIAVGASDREDKQANYSPNREYPFTPPRFIPDPDFPRIDIVAPSHSFFRRVAANRNLDEGGNVFTTDMGGSSGYNNVKFSLMGVPPEYNPSEGTNYMSYTGRFGGTSAAAPQVAGVIALILDANPNLTMPEVLDILFQTADKIGGYDYDYDNISFPDQSFETGYGRVNAGNAVFAALGLEFCGVGDDWVISSNEVIENDYFSPGNIEISSGGELTIRSNVYLSDDKSIIVNDGGKLILDGSEAIIDKCVESNHWQGIKVEAGGELVVNGGTILNAINAINAYGPSIVNIDGITIQGTGPSQGSGIKFLENVSANTFRKINIRDCEYGINIAASNQFYHISTGEIFNVKVGVSIALTSALVTGLEIESEVGINLINSFGSIVHGNRITSAKIGINAYRTHNSLIEYNWIGTQAEYGREGINLVFNRGVRIKSHPIIKAQKIGIRSDLSDVYIQNNNIIVNGIINRFGGGIFLSHESHSQISNNYLDIKRSSFGIESNNNNNTIITKNYIKTLSTFFNRTAAIRSVGSIHEEIMDNLIEGVGNTTGILAQNSSYNTYQCNEVDNTAEGLGIYHNSPIHLIRGNDFSASIDLAIRSMVGVHVRQGNKFKGGSTKAIGLDPNELDDSRFFVNSAIPYHMPTDPVPGNNEWFRNDVNQNYYDDCDSPGPNWVPFDGDPTEICQYYQYLKSPDSLNPNKYFLGVFDLLFLSEMDGSFTLPNCVLLDQQFQNLCGLSALVNVVLGLDSLGMQIIEADSLISYQDQWVEETDSTAKDQLRSMIETEISSLYSDFSSGTQQDSMELENMLNLLNSINCSSGLAGVWSQIYSQYVKFLRNEGKVDSTDHSLLQQYSSLCSDVYGKPVHLARSITATFDTTYYDYYDDCIYGMEPRIVRSTPEEDHKIKLYPNPTTGLLKIGLPDNYIGELTVLDLSGKVVSTYTIENSEKYTLQMPEQSGMYLLRFESSNGKSEQHKILVIDK